MPAEQPAGLTRSPVIGPLPWDDDGVAEVYRWPNAAGTHWVVRANMVASLDGAGSLDGRSAGLSSAVDQRLFAILRDLADVILVGAGTVRAEGYGGVRLNTARAARRQRWGFSGPPPIAVVTEHGLPADSPLFTDTVVPPIVITTEDAGLHGLDGLARVVIAGRERIELGPALETLETFGLRRIHCEGGPRLLRALIEADLLDELCVTVAPLLVGEPSPRLLSGTLSQPRRWSLRALHAADDQLFGLYDRPAQHDQHRQRVPA